MPKCTKIEKPKTIKIEATTLKELQLQKIKMGFTNYSDTLDEIFKWWNWWVQPGQGRKQGNGYDQSKK